MYGWSHSDLGAQGSNSRIRQNVSLCPTKFKLIQGRTPSSTNNYELHAPTMLACTKDSICKISSLIMTLDPQSLVQRPSNIAMHKKKQPTLLPFSRYESLSKKGSKKRTYENQSAL